MKLTRHSPPAALALCIMFGIAVAACSNDQTAPTDAEGWFSAKIQASSGTADADETTYSGTGFFTSSTDFSHLPPEVHEFFALFSEGVGSSEGQMISLTRISAERPDVGSYSVIAPQQEQPGTSDWSARYQATRGDSIAQFTTIGGELEITASSAERIEGRFTFQAVHILTCSTDWWRNGIEPGEFPESPCSLHLEPGTPISELPVVEISGSFSVVNGPLCYERDTGNDPARIGGGPVAIVCLRGPSQG